MERQLASALKAPEECPNRVSRVTGAISGSGTSFHNDQVPVSAVGSAGCVTYRAQLPGSQRDKDTDNDADDREPKGMPESSKGVR
jgi:hypothetical protein